MTSGVSGTSKSRSPSPEYVTVGKAVNIKKKKKKESTQPEQSTEVKQGKGGTTPSLTSYVIDNYKQS